MPEHLTILDADGVPHSYSVELHPYHEGAAISWALGGAAAPSIPRLIALALGEAGGLKAWDRAKERAQTALAKWRDAGEVEADKPDVEAIMAEELERFLSTIDLAQMGMDLGSLFRSLDGPGLVSKVLAHTERDGVPLVGSALDCYRGNYVEMWSAAVQVARLNRFFPVPSGLPGAEG